jgi:hypothetical protein
LFKFRICSVFENISILKIYSNSKNEKQNKIENRKQNQKSEENRPTDTKPTRTCEKPSQNVIEYS